MIYCKIGVGGWGGGVILDFSKVQVKGESHKIKEAQRYCNSCGQSIIFIYADHFTDQSYQIIRRIEISSRFIFLKVLHENMDENCHKPMHHFSS